MNSSSNAVRGAETATEQLQLELERLRSELDRCTTRLQLTEKLLEHVAAGGIFDISGLTSGGMTAGSIEGAGTYSLGSKSLTVGGNNLSTEVSGIIADGGFLGGTGGSLVKVGAGCVFESLMQLLEKFRAKNRYAVSSFPISTNRFGRLASSVWIVMENIPRIHQNFLG